MAGFDIWSLLILLLIGIGVALIVIASIGLLRMPDLYLRTSVASKGSTLGIASIMLAVAIYFGELGTSSRAIAVIIFMMLTAPVAAHMLARAAYRDGAMLWADTYTNSGPEDHIATKGANLD